MSDPYRDELTALRVENERLRRLLRDPLRARRRRALLMWTAAGELLVGAGSMAALWGLLPLLNAPNDGRFFAGVGAAVLIVAVDVAVIVALAEHAAREDRERTD